MQYIIYKKADYLKVSLLMIIIKKSFLSLLCILSNKYKNLSLVEKLYM